MFYTRINAQTVVIFPEMAVVVAPLCPEMHEVVGTALNTRRFLALWAWWYCSRVKVKTKYETKFSEFSPEEEKSR